MYQKKPQNGQKSIFPKRVVRILLSTSQGQHGSSSFAFSPNLQLRNEEPKSELSSNYNFFFYMFINFICVYKWQGQWTITFVELMSLNASCSAIIFLKNSSKDIGQGIFPDKKS